MLRKSCLKLGAIVALSAGAITSIATFTHANYHTAFLTSGDSTTYEGYFLAYEDIYASCDRNCEDLDIYLYDSHLAVLKSCLILRQGYD